MIKKIIVVAFLTGISQIISLISVWYLKFLNQSLVYDIGNYESLIVIFTAIISLGLQLVTVRDIAVSDKWKQILLNSQRDRLTFSLFILASVIFVDLFLQKIEIETLFFYLVIPLIGLNADYSFYGKGESERGAFLSFLRVGILSLFIILSVIFKNPYIKITYIITILVTYFLIGILSAYFNKQNYLTLPKLDFYRSYIKSLDVGLASFSLVFFGLGVVSFASYFYNEEAVTNAYLLLKIYVFYIGIKRLLVQILFKELTQNYLVKIVDQIGIVVGLTVIFVLVYFPEFSIRFFAKDYEKAVHSLGYLLPAVFFTSFTYSGSLQLLFRNKDRIYSLGFIIGAISVLFLVFIFSFMDNNNEANIYLSISIGEFVVILIHGWGLNKIMFFMSRGKFTLLVGIVLFILNYVLLSIGVKILSFILFIVIVGIIGILYYAKKFKKIQSVDI